jgi:hypothetical protein
VGHSIHGSVGPGQLDFVRVLVDRDHGSEDDRRAIVDRREGRDTLTYLCRR